MFGLGDLEGAVMEVLWHADRPARVRAQWPPAGLYDRHDGAGQPAPQGWVPRTMDGRAYRYRPTLSREDATVRALRDVLNASGGPEAALLRFARSVSDQETGVLRAALAEKARGG